MFLSPDLLTDITAKRCVRTLFVTAGDAGLSTSYWQSREQGIEKAYSYMAGVANAWTTSSITLDGKSVRLRTLNAAPSISVVFMRLPDGFPLGTGSEAQGYQSLYKLLNGDISTISAVDGSNSYDSSSLRDALIDAMSSKNFTQVRTQDYVTAYGDDSDHFDHHATAYLTRDASENYEPAHRLSSYLGYGSDGWSANVTGTNLTRKTQAFNYYSDYDSEVNFDYYMGLGWVQRQYVIATEGSSVAASAGADRSPC